MSGAIPALVLVAALVCASILDARTGRIPNALTGPLVASGVVYHAACGSLRTALLGVAVGAVVQIALWQARVHRGGDAKLLIGVGAWGGAGVMLETTLWAYLALVPVGLVQLHRAGRLANLGVVAHRVHAAATGRAGPALPATRMIFGPLILLGWSIAWRTPAWADDAPSAGTPAPSESTVPSEAPEPSEASPSNDGVAPKQAPGATEKLRWTPMFVPGFGFNNIDGLGVGLGGQMFGRPASMEHGYRWLLGASLWTTLPATYQAHTARFDYRSETRRASGLLAYRNWENLRWAGVGGARALVDGGEEEGGSQLTAVHGTFALARPLPSLPFAPFAQVYARYVALTPGGPLADDLPYGSTGGAYTQLSVGIDADTVDRWPMPSRGVRAEASVGAAVLVPRAVDGAEGRPDVDTTVRTVGLTHLEIIHWKPLLREPRRLVLGTRLVFGHAMGALPVFEQSNVAGRWRDELGGEQLLSGYGRTRTRGDGVAAAMIELRPWLFSVRRGKFEMDVHLSAFAEQAWLFQKWDPGPPMPTLGVGPDLLIQGALQLRPFIAWGWRADELGGPRRPVPQFGVSFFDPL